MFVPSEHSRLRHHLVVAFRSPFNHSATMPSDWCAHPPHPIFTSLSGCGACADLALARAPHAPSHPRRARRALPRCRFSWASSSFSIAPPDLPRRISPDQCQDQPRPLRSASAAAGRSSSLPLPAPLGRAPKTVSSLLLLPAPGVPPVGRG